MNPIARYCPFSLVIVTLIYSALISGCSSNLVLALSSDKENTRFFVDDREVGHGQYVTAVIDQGEVKPHKIVARRDNYCDIPDSISPPYTKPTPVEFVFSEDRACIPCPEPCKPEYGKFHALVIGNNDYKNLKKLETASNDAFEVSEVLKKDYGFSVTYLPDATKEQILTALDNIKTGKEGQPKLSESDNFLIFYAGHGQVIDTSEQDKQGYWLPVDAKEDDPKTWIANSYIVSELKKIGVRHALVVADSCYSGMIMRRDINVEYRGLDRYRLGTVEYKGRFWRLFSKRSRTALTSGGVEPVVDRGGKGNHSVFTSTLLSVLKGNVGVFDATSLFVKVRGKVITNADQTPEYGAIHLAGHDGGDFLFVKHGNEANHEN